MKLVFATNNQHKLEEIRKILQPKFEIVSLNEIGCHTDIPETGSTLEENALIKARYVFDNYGLDCFADDTGLEVEALNGAPGVYSARYAGDGHDSAANRRKLLKDMNCQTDRRARFRTVICLIENGEEHLFEGEVKGQILDEERGSFGFGYDAVFMPDEYDRTFAELGETVKNKISHRAKAVEQLCRYLRKK